MKYRLDQELVRRGLAPSREQAQHLIESGAVLVQGIRVTKSASNVDSAVSIVLEERHDDFVSRGGHKLVGALDAFGFDVAGLRCLDAGASTGGFTDVLLRRGAAEVLAVDVGYGQLAWSLQSDQRVQIFDRTNIRYLTVEMLGGPVDLVVADLSFISLTLVLRALSSVTKPEGSMILMVKPQFEVGRERLGNGGVVREPALREWSISHVLAEAISLGWGGMGVAASPLPGPSGNVEYFLWLQQGAGAVGADEIHQAVLDGPQ